MSAKMKGFILTIIIVLGCVIWENKVVGNNVERLYTSYYAGVTDLTTDKIYNMDYLVPVMGNKVSKEKKTVFLTFDDGPSKCTEEILDILKDNNVRATFFLIGNQINSKTVPSLKRMKKMGCQIGVHTYSHEADIIYASEDAYYKDVMKVEEIIMKKTDVVPLVYRFPWGSNNCYLNGFRKKIVNRLKKNGLEYCDWNVSGEDSIGDPGAAAIVANVRNNFDMYNEPVVLLHDSATSEETVKALPKIIKMYKQAGYSFGIISERSKIYQWKLQ